MLRLSAASPLRRALADAAAVTASAAAFALYARGGWPWVAFGWVGLLPWLVALDRAPTRRRALALGVAMSVAFELAVFGWFAYAIADYAAAPPTVLLAVIALSAPLLQPQFVVVALARSAVRRARPDAIAATVVVTAAAYVATEAFTPKLFGDTLGYPLHASRWLRQAADLAGVPGLTAVIVAVNGCFAAAVAALCRRAPDGTRAARAAVAPLAAGATLVAALAAYGAWRVHAFAADPAAPSVTVGLVQANLGHYDRMAEEIGRFATVRTILDEHVALSQAALAHPDLGVLIWPETVYPTTFGRPKSDAGAEFDTEIVQFVAQARVPLVFGSYDTEGDAEFNAAMFLAPDAGAAKPFAVYRKTRLFPLTERVPALLDVPWLRRALPWLGTWVQGAGARVVPVRLPDGALLQVAPLICYDVLDPALARASARAGADAILTLSNDSWFAFGPGPALHLEGAIFRSIETRLPQVRSTNTGISAVIDATGDVVATIGVGERGTLVRSIVPRRGEPTPVVRYGEWLSPLAVLVTLGILFMSSRR